jgi:hypothetical protein
LYNLQLINEATNFTEHSQSLIDLILTNNPSFITYTEVGPALTDLTRFHCPTYDIFNCKKHISSCCKRNIWLYEKGNYDDLRRDLQSVQWDTLIIENDVNQSVANVTRTILQIAMSNVPNETITIRTKDCPWITNDIKRTIRKKIAIIRERNVQSQYCTGNVSVILEMSARLKLGMQR